MDIYDCYRVGDANVKIYLKMLYSKKYFFSI